MHFTQLFFEYVSNNLDEIPFLKQLAKFHSLCIAFRRLQPDIYNTKIKPFLKPVNLNENPKIHEAINVKKFILQFLFDDFITSKIFHLFIQSLSVINIRDSAAKCISLTILIQNSAIKSINTWRLILIYTLVILLILHSQQFFKKIYGSIILWSKRVNAYLNKNLSLNNAIYLFCSLYRWSI